MKKKILATIVCSLALASKGASPDLSKGIDLTGLSSVTTAQLNQLVDNATPATNRGMIIVSLTEPVVGTYPRFTNYAWLDISVAPYVLKVYTTGTWASASIGANTISTAMIQAGAVTGIKIATDAITTTNILNNAVTDVKIADGSITPLKYAAGSIMDVAISNNAVTTLKIATNAVTTERVNDAAITAPKMANDSVATANITNLAVTSAKIAVGTITSNNVANAGLTATNIAVGSSANQYVRANDAGTMAYMSGGIGSYVYTNIQTLIDCSNPLPVDNSVPADTEGDLIGTLTITPKSTNSVLEITVSGFGESSVNAFGVALFKSGSGAAISAVAGQTHAATTAGSFILHHTIATGVASPVTFTIRAGPISAGNFYVNGVSAGQVFNNVAGTHFSIKEIFQ